MHSSNSNRKKSPQNILPTNPSLPPQPNKITLPTLLPGRIRFDAMDFLKQPLQPILQIFVFRALVEFAQEMPACDQTVVAESESRHAEVLFRGKGGRGVWLVKIVSFLGVKKSRFCLGWVVRCGGDRKVGIEGKVCSTKTYNRSRMVAKWVAGCVHHPAIRPVNAVGPRTELETGEGRAHV